LFKHLLAKALLLSAGASTKGRAYSEQVCAEKSFVKEQTSLQEKEVSNLLIPRAPTSKYKSLKIHITARTYIGVIMTPSGSCFENLTIGACVIFFETDTHSNESTGENSTLATFGSKSLQPSRNSILVFLILLRPVGKVFFKGLRRLNPSKFNDEKEFST